MTEEKKKKLTEFARRYLEWADLEEKEKPRLSPGAPNGERILVRQKPTSDLAGPKGAAVIITPEIARIKPWYGIILDAGCKAADQLYDNGHEVGDRIVYAKYAGVIEEWEHFLDEGDPNCHHIYEHLPTKVDNTQSRACEMCSAVLVKEECIAMTTKDIQLNIDLQLRIEKGLVRRQRAETADGQTCHVIERLYESTSWVTQERTKKARVA